MAAVGADLHTLVAGFVVTYLSAMRLEIRPDGISYTNLFHGTAGVNFSDISMAVIYTSSVPRSGTWADRRMVGKLVITPKPETGKPTLTISISYLPMAAQEQLLGLLKPEEWDVAG
jgi:hypothetical protein